MFTSFSAAQTRAYALFRDTVSGKLLTDPRLQSVWNQTAIIAIGSHTFDCGDPWSDYDLLAIVSDPFSAGLIEKWPQNGAAWPSIVETGPPEITTKIRSESWLTEESDRELAIMTFIIRHAWVFEDPQGVFATCLARLSQKFETQSMPLRDRKLAQLRNTLYQLEQAETRGERVAVRP